MLGQVLGSRARVLPLQLVLPGLLEPEPGQPLNQLLLLKSAQHLAHRHRCMHGGMQAWRWWHMAGMEMAGTACIHDLVLPHRSIPRHRAGNQVINGCPNLLRGRRLDGAGSPCEARPVWATRKGSSRVWHSTACNAIASQIQATMGGLRHADRHLW